MNTMNDPKSLALNCAPTLWRRLKLASAMKKAIRRDRLLRSADTYPTIDGDGTRYGNPALIGKMKSMKTKRPVGSNGGQGGRKGGR